ncbi:MAG: fimbrial protein [Providencia sp.]|uniref:fimbrial protein n=1 Tax=Providencia sp. TaxID=589 RepID=UPI003F9CC5FC
MTKCVIFLFSLLFLTANSSVANSLVVYFEGVLVPLGCRLSDDDAQKKINLSGLRFSSLETLGRSEMQPFKLDIMDCSEMTLNKTIKITLNTQNSEAHNGINYLKTTGESNVLLALTDSNGKELNLNKKIDVSTVTASGKGSVNTLSLGVYVQKPFNARLKTGGFASIVTFNLDYQ